MGMSLQISLKMNVTSSGNVPDGYLTNSIKRCTADSVGCARHVAMIRSAEVYLSNPSVARRRRLPCLERRIGTGHALPEPMNGLRRFAWVRVHVSPVVRNQPNARITYARAENLL